MTDAQMAALRRALLDWYDAHHRDLPWRARGGSAPDPYHVWLSEIMLQQTRVDTVRPYFERWLERFPTLESLSEARQDDVLKAWEGLGYYSRARNLHRAVREVVSVYGGRVPADPKKFRSLPGVGRYTAGAVMSIAFGREEPVVDGNVRRVFARLLDEPTPADADLWELAERLVPGERPGDLNQSLMELGATICTPRSPECPSCPVMRFCAAREAGTQNERPLPRPRRSIPTEHHAVAIVVHAGKTLLVRRPEGGRLAGMWEFPGVARLKVESVADGAIRAAAHWAQVAVSVDREVGSVEHVFTHVRVNYEAVLARVNGPVPQPDDDAVRWVDPSELKRFALPRAQQRIAELLHMAAGSEVLSNASG